VVPVSSTDRKQEERLMARIRNMPGVTGVTGALTRMGSSLGRNEIVFRGTNGEHRLRCTNTFIDFNYLTFYDIKMKAGRSFSAEYGEDRNGQSYVINESMARELLSLSPSGDTSIAGLIGKGIRYGWEDSLGTIIGITRDFNFSTLHHRIEPLCMNYLKEYFFTDLSIRVDTKKMTGTISEIEQNWKELLTGQPFSYYFLDSYLQQLYRSDTQTSIFIAIFTVIAFFVSCLGLVGVAAFNIERRTKEIGIRKVLGATVANIVFLLSIGFVRLVLISIVIAIPIAWWAIDRWMEGFAYHIDINLWMFIVAGMIALLIAVLTSGFQAVRAAVSNPVDSIKVE
jgi:putative ABC transport system permease protein